MLRRIAAVVCGFLIWTVLWLGSNAGLAAMAPGSFNEDGTTDSGGILALMLVLSVVFSVASGFATAAISGTKAIPDSWALGFLLLLVGIFVQAQYWDRMPLWYHLCYLILLVPAAVIGGALRRSRSTSGGGISTSLGKA